MCDYLERMKKINVPTKEIRLWSGLAHRVTEYTGQFPTPEDRIIMLWLHKESATMLLDMCDDIDKKFSELETENADLREVLRYADDKNIHLRDAIYKEHIHARKLKSENAKLRKFCEDLIQLPAVPSFDCYGCRYDKWEDCGGMLKDCQLIKEAIKLGIKIPSEEDN